MQQLYAYKKGNKVFIKLYGIEYEILIPEVKEVKEIKKETKKTEMEKKTKKEIKE
jgi:hypothetical protein